MADPVNRRRAERTELACSCELAINAPAWAMTRGPLRGTTENITEHGVRIVFHGFPGDRAELWQKAIARDDAPTASVNFDRSSGLPQLSGRIVWVHYIADPQTGGTCSIGILFEVLGQGDLQTLRKAMSAI